MRAHNKITTTLFAVAFAMCVSGFWYFPLSILGFILAWGTFLNALSWLVEDIPEMVDEAFSRKLLPRPIDYGSALIWRRGEWRGRAARENRITGKRYWLENDMWMGPLGLGYHDEFTAASNPQKQP